MLRRTLKSLPTREHLWAFEVPKPTRRAALAVILPSAKISHGMKLRFGKPPAPGAEVPGARTRFVPRSIECAAVIAHQAVPSSGGGIGQLQSDNPKQIARVGTHHDFAALQFYDGIPGTPPIPVIQS